jgi:hypothetical protein
VRTGTGVFMANIYISKLDAAKRQLDVAINLFFKNGDPVSIHTLTAAAYDVLIGLGKTAKVVELGVKDVELYVKEGHQKEYFAILNKAQNFFKHADKDQKEILEFNPELTSHFLLSAVKLYTDLTKEKPNNMTVYVFWFGLMYPNLLKEEYKKEYEYRRNQLNPADRSKFLNLIHQF